MLWGILFITVSQLQGELGANAMLAVSIAACKAGAAEKEAWVILFIFYF
jgi:enolase